MVSELLKGKKYLWVPIIVFVLIITFSFSWNELNSASLANDDKLILNTQDDKLIPNTQDNELIPNTHRKLKNLEPLTIVCIGSSSTEGTGTTNSNETYPGQLEYKLREIYPNSNITVINKGIGGITAAKMVERFEKDVYPFNPDLVIWQTGTIEAINKLDYSDFLSTLKKGLTILKEHNYEVLLLDSQYFPGVGESELYQKYVNSMEQVGKEMNIYVIHRYQYMRELVESNKYKWKDLLYSDNFHPSLLMYKLTAEYTVTILETKLFR